MAQKNDSKLSFNEVRMKLLLKEATTIKDNIARERDRLREIASEFSDVTDSLDSALPELEHALDTISQYL